MRLSQSFTLASVCCAVCIMVATLTTTVPAKGKTMKLPKGYETEAREYLTGLLYKKSDIANWFSRSAFPFCKYDSIMGYVHIDRRFQEGLDNSWVTYTYDIHDARRTKETRHRYSLTWHPTLSEMNWRVEVRAAVL